MAQNGDKVTFWRGSVKVFNKLREDGRLTANRLYFVGNSQTDSEGLRDSTYGTIYLATSAKWCVRFGIFSENADLDRIANEIFASIEKEGAERAKADGELSERLTAEATARQTADTEIKALLASDYATKAELQAEADTLRDGISDEATARASADASLRADIETETAARKNADDLKADKSTTYTKTEADNLLDEKADASTTYTKTEADGLLSGKADKSALANYYPKTETYTKDEVDSLVEAKVAFQVVDALPTSGETAVIYLVPVADPGTQNIYDEFMWIGGAWEHIGSTETDLSDYYTKGETDTRLNTKANASNVYTKTETDTKLGAKADKTALGSYYTKTESDALLSAKQGTITGGATTITTNDLTASRVLVSDSDGKVGVSIVTSGELAYMQGVTSNLQLQITSKADRSEVAAQIGSLTYKLNDEVTARETAVSDAKTELQADIDTKADKAAVLEGFQGARTFPLLLKDGTDAPRWLFGDFVDYTFDPIGSLSVTHFTNTLGPTRLNIGGVQCGEIYLRGYGNNGWTSIKPSEGNVILTLPSQSGTLATGATISSYTETYCVYLNRYESDMSTINGRLSGLETFDTIVTTRISDLYTAVGGKEDALYVISNEDIDTLIADVCV